MYPDPSVAAFVGERFVPFRAHVKEQPSAFERFDVQWTPTVLVADADGTERHRFEGFLPAVDFLAQLRLGLGHLHRQRGDFGRAEQLFRELADDPAAGEAGAEAQYWAGVARYKGTGDAAALAETGRQFEQRFADTPWAKRASVWRS